MPISSFPNGFLDGISIRGLPINVAHPNEVYWVNNTTVLPKHGIAGSDGNPGTYQKPFKTLNGAISNAKLLANSGVIIVIAPGHSETITSSTTLALNKAGIAIIGLGDGDLRPTFLFSATTSQVVITGANCSWKNCILKATTGSVVAGVSIQADGVELDLETQDGSSSHFFLIPYLTTSACSNLKMNWKHMGLATATQTYGVKLVGVVNANIVVDFYGYASTAVVGMATTACKNIEVTGTFNNSAGALTYDVVDSASSTWSVNGFEANSGQMFSGSNNTAVAYYPVAITNNQTVSLLKATVGLPATGNTTIFTITGGPIIVEEIYGVVTTVIQTQACNLKLTSVDTATSTATDLCANLNISGDAAGSFYNVTGTLANALVNTAGGTAIGQAGTVLVPAGIIRITTSATNTGSVAWGIRYRPLAAGVTVA